LCSLTSIKDIQDNFNYWSSHSENIITLIIESKKYINQKEEEILDNEEPEPDDEENDTTNNLLISPNQILEKAKITLSQMISLFHSNNIEINRDLTLLVD